MAVTQDLDMAQYLDLFLQEAEEQLEVLEREALRLEQEATPEGTHVIFRAAHTLKGSSRAMGFTAFASLTHEMENVLEAVRSERVLLDSNIVDVLLRCIDALSGMRHQIAETGSDAWDVEPLVKALSGFVTAAESAPCQSREVPAAVRTALQEAAKGTSVYHARIRLREDCAMPYARAYMAITAINARGEVYATVPDVEALEAESFGSEFELYFQCRESRESIEKVLKEVGEIASCMVEPFVAEETAPVAPAAATPASVAPAESSAAEAMNGFRREAHTVRVDVARLDELMNLVGELVIDRTRISQIGAALAAKYDVDSNVAALAETVGHVTRITSDLQDILLKARMMPIETVFNRLPRLVRDLAQRMDKRVRLDLEGGETELDRSVIESLGDPLIHILRNSIDHGIETPEERQRAGKPEEGVIRVAAWHQENHIILEISDDGKGVDVARVKAKAVEKGLVSKEAAERMTDKESLGLIFASGLSTAQSVSDVSGRGVGMDIVRTNIQRLGGMIDVESRPGQGCKLTLRLPLTLAIIRGLLVRVGPVDYVLPLTSVLETLRVPITEIQTVGGKDVILLRGSTAPLVYLERVFSLHGYAPTVTEEDAKFVVIVGMAEHRVGIVVDKLVGEQEVVIKSLNRFCGEPVGISGATILGNGRVALIADVNAVIDLARKGLQG